LNTPIWAPSEGRIKNSNMSAYMSFISRMLKRRISTYEELYNWSVTDIEEFWKSIWLFAGIIHSEEYKSVLSDYSMPGARWFEGAKLNFAQNLLRYRDNHTAIISSWEGLPTQKISYAELFRYVSSCSDYLRKSGVIKGDRIAGFITNTPEAIIAMLAAASIGAIWSSCSPDFGLNGVLDRFGQIHPKILFAVDSYQYYGQIINCNEKLEQIAGNIPSIEKVVLIDRNFRFNQDIPDEDIQISYSEKYVHFEQLIANKAADIVFEQLPFNHPVYIMYSSGTTGVPKCIVHGAGGTLLQHFKELSLHTNITRHDVITYYTTCGWMMWNWLVSALHIGASIFLYDGNPSYPNIEALWQKIDEEEISVFGTSPKFLSTCKKVNLIPKNKFRLTSLKLILSTGSPLPPEIFEYVYSSIKEDVQLSSISGGTDIISCFVLGNPNLPVYPGEIQCRGLGMKVEAFNENGRSVIDEKGEMVCTAPFPSMPVYFWDDPEGKKYNEAYFEYYPGIWRHGDYIKITRSGGVIIYGRSDATLNPGGVRIGTAEIYPAVEALDEVADSIAVGQRWKNDVRIILFVVLRNNLI
jgi:acetoacetyl-CoA synthetase